MIDRDLSDLIDNRRRRKQKATVIGKVTKVFQKEHNDDSEGNIEVNVQTRNSRHEFRRIPCINWDHSGHTRVPQVGDYVTVEWMMGRGRQPVVTGGTPTDEDRSPNARAGHWRHEFRNDALPDHVYLEAEPRGSGRGDPELVRMAAKGSGLSTPTTEFGVDLSQVPQGGDPRIRGETDGNIELETTNKGYLDIQIDEEDITISISTEGDVDVRTDEGDVSVTTDKGNIDVTSNDGNVTLDANGTVNVTANDVVVHTDEGPKSVAYNDHTHDYEKSDGTTGTTDQPNEDGTKTTIG